MVQANATRWFVVAAVEPLTAVILVGEGNTYGQPAPETLDRLGSRPVLRTDRHGDVKMSTDGRRLWVKTERGGAYGDTLDMVLGTLFPTLPPTGSMKTAHGGEHAW